ncbi:sigma-54-dependent Fis family transcriptional regulator [Nocardioides sp. LHG3406-4]|uniref:sigma-54-dependent Fis family transcriptional regulator n=1 Tax=Nocardioides sp. LHG3406-4 TaxID=2804575 RepID=UPI003CEDD659
MPMIALGDGGIFVSDIDSNGAIERAKEDFLSAIETESAPSEALLGSWRRSHAALGSPANVTEVPHVADELLDTQLLDMFRAPLQRFSETLDGTHLGLLLADASGRILERWSADRRVEAHFDRMGTTRGAVLAEEAVGTNGVGTAIAARKLVQVRGAEHFADFYQQAVCTGAPVLHPLSGKLLAVVTLSCDVTPRAELLRPLLQTVTGQLQKQVLDIEQPASRRALTAFLHYAETRSEPVVAIGPDGLVIQNARASHLTREQLAEIQQLCLDLPAGDGRPRLIKLDELTVEITPVERDNHVAVVVDTPTRTLSAPRTATPHAKLIGRAPEWLAVLHQVAKARQGDEPVLLAGETGVGKTSVALGRPSTPGADDAARVVDGAESHLVGVQEWLKTVSARLESGDPVCIRSVETLEKAAVAGLRAAMQKSAAGSRVTLTLTTNELDDAEELARRLGGARVVWVPSLRARAADVPELWNSIAQSVAPTAGLVLRPDAVPTLRAHRWTGNVSELRSTISQLAASGKRGSVAAVDLPDHMRGTGSTLTLIEQVELQAIRQALEEAGGNRAKAAEILGISRATVYRKMKSYRLDG